MAESSSNFGSSGISSTAAGSGTCISALAGAPATHEPVVSPCPAPGAAPRCSAQTFSACTPATSPAPNSAHGGPAGKESRPAKT